MGAEELLQRVIDRSQRQNAIKTIGLGTVDTVDESSCVLLRKGQPKLYDVRFHATEAKPGSRIVEIPAAGSSVIYAIIENEATEAVILKCSEVTKVLIEIGKVKYVIDEKGHFIANDTDTLADVLKSLIEEIQKIVVINGRGPNIAKLTLLSNSLTKILKANAS